MNDQPKYRRVLLKLSGEAFAGKRQYGIDPGVLDHVAGQIRSVREMDVAIAVVVGGGNIWRGAQAHKAGMDRVTADYAGMLATVINALALQDALERAGVTTRTQSAITVQAVAEPFIRRRAIRHLEKGRVVVFAAGTGNPYMTTDTAAALRAIEIGADLLLAAKSGVDGVYDADPKLDPAASKFDRISFDEALARRLAVIDAAALCLCRDSKLPVVVFNVDDPANIGRALRGEPVGTLIFRP